MRQSSLLLMFLLLGLSFAVFSQNVGINDDNSNPDPSAMLDVKSQTKGMLVPRMTTTRRTSIASPATGLLVYDNTTTSFWFYNGTKWVELLSGKVTDVDTLTLTGNILSISSGNTVDLSAFLDNTDKQTLTFTNDSLSISGGNKVGLSSLNTDSQTLTLNNDSLSISGGNKIDLSSINTDKQILTLTGDSLFISGGNKISLSVFANDTLPLIKDTDGNTKVQVEKNANEDVVRFDMGGTEYFNMTKGGRLSVENSGESVFIGENAGSNDDLTTNKNVAIGYQSLMNNITGVGNVGVGFNTLQNTTANSNTAVGYNVLPSNTSGQFNSAFGQNSLLGNTTGNYNVALGGQALASNTTGSGNIAIGMDAYSSHSTGNDNVVIGYKAGANNISGGGNVFLGYAAGTNETGSDKLFIENSNSSTPLIYGNFANDSVKIYGTLNIQNKYSFPNADGTSNQLMMTNGAGVLSWISPFALGITETDPKVGTLTSNYLPKWGTTTLVNSLIYDNGTNVGIGTTSPSQKLHVEGTILSENPGTSPNGSSISLSSPANDIGVTLNRGDGAGGVAQRWDMKVTSDKSLRFRSANTNDYVTFTNTGLVGIGPTSPSAYLDITGTNSGTTSLFLRSGNTSAVTSSNQIAFGYNGTSNYAHAIKTRHQSGAKTGNAIDFYIWDQGVDAISTIGSKRVMTIDGNNNGMVGIGTSTPQNELHVVGNIRMVDGNQAAGKVMVSDANGMASWASSASLSITETDPNSWLKTGNAGTTPGTNFIGTTDAKALMFKVNNNKAGYIDYASPYAVSLGYQALNSNTATYNAALGYQALYSNTTGQNNIAIGYKALYSNNTTSASVAIGSNALFNSTGDGNTAIGLSTLYSNTTGAYNVAIGPQALLANTTGTRNIAIGINTMVNNTTGYNNTAVGVDALGTNTTGSFNIASGYLSLNKNTTGGYNTAYGYRSLYNNTTGGWNTGSGNDALMSNTTGTDNSAFGNSALLNNTTGWNNIAVGSHALENSSTGNANTVIGKDAFYNNVSGGNNVGLGYQAGYNETGSNKLYIENSNSSTPLIYGNFADDSVKIYGTLNVRNKYSFPNADGSSGQVLTTDGAGALSWANAAVNTDAQTLSIDNTKASLSITNGNSVVLSTLADADGNTKIQVEKNANEDKIRFDLGGTEIYRFEPTRIQISNTSNVFMGDLAGSTNTSGSDNVGIGKNSLASNTTGYSNISLGTNSLNNNTAGFRNVSIGAGALQQNLIGNNNTAIGYTALNNNTGDDNTALGQQAMIANTSGVGNVSLGKSTLFSNTTGNYNTVIGLYAGYYNTGSSNVFLGNRAGQNETGSNKLYIENTASSAPLIYGNFADDSVKINGDFQVGQNGDGTVAVANAWNTFSDRRYKTDFKVIENALAKVQAVNGYYYKWKDKPDTTLQVGVIAQEIEVVLPQVVTTNAEGYKSVDYSKLTALLIEALKDQQSIIESQEKSISDLKDDMAMIKQYLQLNTEAKK